MTSGQGQYYKELIALTREQSEKQRNVLQKLDYQANITKQMPSMSLSRSQDQVMSP